MAIILVVLYHADVPSLPGGYIGVDVFFVISGYLITSHLLSALFVDGRIHFRAFYARRIRRVLPAALVVLAGTLTFGGMFLPRLQHEAMLRDALAAALYVPNMLFAHDSMDYLADTTPSIVQHYWSLGVEEQFYLVWPVLLFLGFQVARRSRRRLFWVIVGLVAVSFAVGVYLTLRSQPWAFFSLPTRFWELGVGGLVAFLAGKRVSIPPVVALSGGWIGLVGILAAAVFFDARTLFPGFAVALPVLATAAVIYLGLTPTPHGPVRLLGMRGMVFIGAISYSLYLVHWPILLIAEQAGGTGAVMSPLSKIGLVLTAVPVAYLIFRFVEQPFQRARTLQRRPVLVLAAAAAATALFAVVLAGWMQLAAGDSLNSGRAAANAPPASVPEFGGYVPIDLKPSLRQASADNPQIYQDGCHADFTVTKSVGCMFGQPGSPITVALFGDSHAAQWFPALDVLARQGEIRLRVDTKSSCPSVAITKNLNGAPYSACEAWRSDVIYELQLMKPDLIIISNSERGDVQTLDAKKKWEGGLESTIRQLDGTGAVMVLADTPRLPWMPAMCLSAHLGDASACSSDRALALDAQLASGERSVAESTSATYSSLNDYICSTSTCGLIVGNTLVYRDDHHLTATFSRTLSGPLSDAINLALSGRSLAQ